MNLSLPGVKGFLVLLLAASLWMPNPAQAQRRLVLVDQDGSGPADSNQMSMLALLQSAQVEVLESRLSPATRGGMKNFSIRCACSS